MSVEVTWRQERAAWEAYKKYVSPKPQSFMGDDESHALYRAWLPLYLATRQTNKEAA